ncbi:MAG: dienelactone hydrolase family protein, partial [Bacteroidia bacterium]
ADSLTPNLEASLQVLDSVLAHTPNVDSNCVYVTGISMGGFGCWELGQRFPRRWAAIMPICGGGDTARAAQLRDVPVWAFHGQKDKLVKPTRTTDMVQAIERQGGKPLVKLYPSIGHLVWNTVYADRKAIQWLISNRRS